MLKTSLFAITAVAFVSFVAVGCASPTDTSEATGSTTSHLEGNFPQDQVRMIQARRLLRISASMLDTGDKLDLVNEALDDVNQGITFDNNHLSDNEDNRDTSVDDVTVQDALNSCGSDVNCILQDADQDLQGATKDKGGFRVKAITAVESAIALDTTTAGQ